MSAVDHLFGELSGDLVLELVVPPGQRDVGVAEAAVSFIEGGAQPVEHVLAEQALWAARVVMTRMRTGCACAGVARASMASVRAQSSGRSMVVPVMGPSEGVPGAQRQLARYPYGGFAEFCTAAPQRLVRLPDAVGFAQAARFGYLGTSYGGLCAGGVGAGSEIMINGATGTLGVGAVILALGMGATRIFCFGRNQAVLARLAALAPQRIETLVLGTEEIESFVRACTGGVGAGMLPDCSGRAASAEHTLGAIAALCHGGVAVNIGALSEKLALDRFKFMNRATRFQESNWFSTAQGDAMARMAGAGVIDLSVWDTRGFALDEVGEALALVKTRPGGFTNIVVHPDR